MLNSYSFTKKIPLWISPFSSFWNQEEIIEIGEGGIIEAGSGLILFEIGLISFFSVCISYAGTKALIFPNKVLTSLALFLLLPFNVTSFAA